MSNLRKEKVKNLIKDLAAQFLQTESNHTSLITVTDANLSNDFKRATVFVTVFPVDNEESALNFLKRKRKGFKEFVKTRTSMKRIPFFDFEIDLGEENRQKIDKISSGIKKQV